MNVAGKVKGEAAAAASGQSQEASRMYPRQIENIATQHVDELRSRRRPLASGRDGRAIRVHAGWTLIAVGLRLASSASR